MKHLGTIAAASVIATLAGVSAASADDCSGRNHDTGTVVGAAGGAAIGGLASHSVAGAVIGGVAGGLAGNAIARSEDCAKTQHRANDDDRAQAYDEGYQDRAAEDRAEDRNEDRQAKSEPRPLRDDAESADRDYPD
jgi:hypothetical protein